MSIAKSSIPASPSTFAPWQVDISNAVTDLAQLCRILRLADSLATNGQAAARRFPMRIPRTLLARIHPARENDPVLRQFLPQQQEQDPSLGFTDDPLGEGAPAPGTALLKYAHRCLIVATDRCAVHCRFCFRQHTLKVYRGQGGGYGGGGRPAVAEYCNWWLEQVGRNQQIREVILSGGDPLTLPDELLRSMATRLAACKHVRRLRIHTRMPVIIPSRVNQSLLDWLRATRLTPVIVVHVNHPAEIDRAAATALGQLVDAGVPVLSQTVLLRKVNDRADVLAALFEHLVDLRVMPYYLHQLDRVAGAAHFEVPVDEGKRLVAQLRRTLPGYAVPRYVREVPGLPCKQLIR